MKNRLGLTLLGLLGAAAVAGPALAQPNLYNSATAPGATTTAPQTCDPDYWHSMTAKAWMEAEREIIQNKNLIYKPDSVMEYVCFDAFMQHGANTLGNIFSHTTYYNGYSIIPRGTTYSLEQTLSRSVTDTYKTYIANNFGHRFLGERAQYLGRHGAVSDRTIGDASAMGVYTCNIMANIWLASKCENFIDNEHFESDGFFPFDDIDTGPGGKFKAVGYKNMDDPRKFPTACAIKKPDNTANNATWETAIPRSINEEDKMYDFSKPLGKVYEEIRPKLEPGSCSEAIKTGVTVVTDSSGQGGDEDGVCSNPGCSYSGGSCS